MNKEELKKEKTIIKKHTDMDVRGWQVLVFIGLVVLTILYPVELEMSVEGNLDAHYFLPVNEHLIIPFTSSEFVAVYITPANFSFDGIEGKLYLKTRVPLGVLLWQKYSED